MKESFDFLISPDGMVQTIYQDGVEKLVKSMGAEITHIKRASRVEWEVVGSQAGWVVRAAHDHTLALRGAGEFSPSREGRLWVFNDRESALAAEVKFFWELQEKVG